MTNLNVVGKSVLRQDAYEKVVGGKGFPVNISLPGMLHGKMLRSPYPHARILSIDTSRAEKLPGVKAVMTPKDVPQIIFNPIFFMPADSMAIHRDMLILSDTVRFAGQPVAAVAATTVAIAEQALSLIDVEYEELPAVFDPEDAMKEGAPEIHAGVKNNIRATPSFGAGDVEQGFKEADYVFEGTYETQRVHTCYMEPRVCVSDTDSSGHVTIYSSIAHLFGLRERLAYALGLPVSKVTAIQAPYTGGSFGSKLDLAYIEALSALLSAKTKKPVRLEHTRYEDFICNARHPMKVYLKTGVKKDGTITARYASTLCDTSAYSAHGPEVIMVHAYFGLMLGYRAPHTKWEGTVVYTNNMPGGAFRGYGAPQAAFAVESQIDEICEKLGFDPIEFRLKNTPRQGDPHPFNPEWKLGGYALDQCLTKGAERMGWSNRAKAGSASGTKKRGIGMAAHPIWVSGCVGFPDIYEHSGAIIRLNVDGTAYLSSATMDIGSGQNTTLCQIAAEELGLKFESVRMAPGNTDNLPFDAPTHASRVTYSSGNAVKVAAADAKKNLLEVAAIVMEANAADLEVRDGMITVKGAPAKAMSVADVVKRAESPFMVVGAQGPTPTTLKEKGTIMGISSVAPPANASPAVAEFVEVEVDTETGQVKVLRAVYAHDLGRVVNPAAAQGQVEGGLQQGIGYALMEQMLFDPETGACLTSDFLDYKMPTAVEMPSKIECIFIESNEPTGPYGAKSLSEACLIVPAPAIANAIYNAIGVRFHSLPITPEKILAALGKL
ncbi:MAG: molybdopterin-dependent oxidoreductase [Betaproteobacteria bacterium]|nr:molybdopterin-dependent oxidoreductase [Betaproteobacteria bacterium]